MTINELWAQATEETGVEQGKLEIKTFADWYLKNNKLNEFLSAIKEDSLKQIPLSKPYNNKQSIEQLLNSGIFISLAGIIANKGRAKEAEDIFNTILEITPDDTTTLNDYGVLIMNEQIALYYKKQQLSKERIETAMKQTSKAAIIDRALAEEPKQLPAYKNLCLLRAVEAAYYLEEKHFLPAFLLSWMSIEMTLNRIWHTTLKEMGYKKGKIKSLGRWNIDTIIEALFMSKCDPEFLKLKTALDTLRGNRNDLLHGRAYEVPYGTARFSIQTAFALIPIKQK